MGVQSYSLCFLVTGLTCKLSVAVSVLCCIPWWSWTQEVLTYMLFFIIFLGNGVSSQKLKSKYDTPWSKTACGGKGLFSLFASSCVVVPHQRNQGRRSRPEPVGRYCYRIREKLWFLTCFSCFLILLSYRSQDHQTSDGYFPLWSGLYQVTVDQTIGRQSFPQYNPTEGYSDSRSCWL